MANKIYQAVETARTWSDAVTSSDELLDLGGLAADGVVCGSFHDLGAAPRSDLYEVEFLIDGFDTAPVVGEMVELWMTQSNATTGFDGQLIQQPLRRAQPQRLRRKTAPSSVLSESTQPPQETSFKGESLPASQGGTSPQS